MSAAGHGLSFDNVSKFYGEILGVNRVSLTLPPGITSLVGPNGSGKTTLLNLAAGLLRPTRGTVRVLGIPPDRPEELQRRLGYATQYDSFPPGMTARRLLTSFLALRGLPRRRAREMAAHALERVGLTAAADRKVAAFSKGMRQRAKLALATCHEPEVLLLDEPLSGLDPLSRAETVAFFRQQAAAGRHVVVSSHVLHEVDALSDRVVLIHGGYVVAEGAVSGVREEMERHPLQVLVRCDRPSLLASRLFAQDHVVEAAVHEDGQGLSVRTRDPDRFYLLLNRVVLDTGLEVSTVTPADSDVGSVYQYLIGGEYPAGGPGGSR